MWRSGLDDRGELLFVEGSKVVDGILGHEAAECRRRRCTALQSFLVGDGGHRKKLGRIEHRFKRKQRRRGVEKGGGRCWYSNVAARLKGQAFEWLNPCAWPRIGYFLPRSPYGRPWWPQTGLKCSEVLRDAKSCSFVSPKGRQACTSRQ